MVPKWTWILLTFLVIEEFATSGALGRKDKKRERKKAGKMYFTVSSLRMAVPAALLSEKEPILRVEAVAMGREGANGENMHPLISYRLEKPSPWLRLNSTSGYMFLSEEAKAPETGLDKKLRKKEHVEETVVEVVSTHGDNVNIASGKLKMDFVFLPPSDEDDAYCDNEQQQALCFFDNFSFRIMENRQPSKLGTLRPTWLKRICPLLSVTYTVTSGSTNFFDTSLSDENDWYLQTTQPLDRESFEWLPVEVNCALSHKWKGQLTHHRRVINVTVLDEDDSAPIPQITNLDIHVQDPLMLQDKYFKTGRLIVSDADTVEVNNYTINVLMESDPPGILQLRLQNWEVPAGKDEKDGQTEKVISTSFDGSNRPLTRDKMRSTAIHVEVSVIRTVKLPSSIYVVIFNLSDSTLVEKKEEAMVTMHFRIIVDSLSKFQGETETERALSKSIERYDETRGISAGGMSMSQGISLVYPLVLTVPEKCAPYTRLAQPDVLPQIDQFLDAKLSPDDCPIGITPKSGILFVKDPSKLRANSTINIKIGGRGFNQDIHVIVNVTKSRAECAPKNRVTTCASAKLKRTCESLCGVGAPEYCVWRESTNAKGLFPNGFSTCSPNSKSCPDGFCDELEEEDHRICPQDCAHEVFGAVVQNEPHYNSGRGIKGATGVCTCDEFLKCSCVPEYKSNKGKSTAKAVAGYDKEDYSNRQGVQPYNKIKDPGTKKEDSDAKTAKNHFENCGESCLVAVALGVVAAFAIALTGAMYARRRKSAKQDNHELSSAVPITIHHDGGAEGIAAASLGTHSQIYGQDENGRMHQELPLLSIRPSQPYDPKWELPRNALKIDETLGEGEFGMVFKGKLKCTEGNPSSCDEYMTVAVKTLKEDAGEMERHALASEFNLLQGVNHVNVVKLIGACTYPKSLPFLLIIEFAAMGSLRSYLRKSRLCHFNGVSLQKLPITKPFTPEGTSFKDERTNGVVITPKHILSFAWQISKGMTYLSEIKLVHRDLAARNVLLTSDGICKISDFGLTRDVYEDDAYFKRSKGRVPVKWMAPESLCDHIYTTQSDVWGFGILLWELVTLGSTPYPGVPLSGLYNLLQAGYKMEKPGHCSVELYHLMLCCWRLDPRKRPSFQSLMVSLEAMLLDEAEYLQLDSLIAHNMTYFNAFEYDECSTKPVDGDGVEYGSILHRILNDNSDDEDIEQAAGIAVNATQHLSKIEENERQVEYTWLWKGNKKRGWNEKTLSQSLLSETDEIDDDSSAMDYSQGNCDKEEAINANQELTEYVCPIRLPEKTQNIPQDVATPSDGAD